MSPHRANYLLVLSILLFNQTLAFWRMPCGIVQTGRIDPVVFPDQVSAHVHKLSGASNIDIDSTHDSLLTAQCTSCAVQQDRSGYWAPQLYYQYANGSFYEVRSNYMLIYYLSRGPTELLNTVVPYPHGFKMLSGDPYKRAYDNVTKTWDNSTNIAERVSFDCIDATLGSIWQDNHIRDYNCTGGIRAQIGFPSCWDNHTLYAADGSHVAYLSQVSQGSCPDTHPVLLPYLFYEVDYYVSEIDDGKGQFVWAMGDPTGFGFHGDFINGWNDTLLAAAVKDCLVPDNNGLIANCTHFVPYALETDFDLDCGPQPPRINESALGLLETLPGCNYVQPGPPAGPAEATVATNCVQTPIPARINQEPQTASTYPFPTPSAAVGNAGWEYVGCYDNNVNNTDSIGTTGFDDDNMSVTKCQTYCAGKQFSTAGLTRQTHCTCGTGVLPGTPTIGFMDGCLAICPGNSSEFCGDYVLYAVFTNTEYSGAPPGAGPTPAAAGKYLGCATDNVAGPALGLAPFDSQGDMTNQQCRKYCDGLGLYLSGTEYSAQCYCGNTLLNGNMLLDSGFTCNMVCNGDSNQTCGGPNRLSVYASLNISAPVGAPVVSSSSSAAASSSSSMNAPGNPAPSATSHIVSTSSLAAQPTSKSTSSSAAGMNGDSGASSSGAMRTSSSMQGMPETSSTTTSPMSPTTSTTAIIPTNAAGYIGCASDPHAENPALSMADTAAPDMTAELCMSWCVSKGYGLAGIGSGNQCSCGNYLSPDSGSQMLASDAPCNIACAGNAGEFCGGAGFLSLYWATGLEPEVNFRKRSLEL